MINSTTGRMTTEHMVNFFCTFLSYGLGMMLEKVEGVLKVGVAGSVPLPREIIFLMTSIFPLGYKMIHKLPFLLHEIYL